MRLINTLSMMLAIMASLTFIGCNDTKSYAELLTEENLATNAFLVNQRVVGHLPADTIFEVGPDAPYYQIDDNGEVYMQVLKLGTKGNMAETGELIYIRYTRYSLYSYTYDKDRQGEKGYYGEFGDGEGNDKDMTTGSSSIRFDNPRANSSYQWGTGIQRPLYLVPIDSEINLLLKSQSGINSEISYVTPYLYRVRYFKSQI